MLLLALGLLPLPPEKPDGETERTREDEDPPSDEPPADVELRGETLFEMLTEVVSDARAAPRGEATGGWSGLARV